MSQWLPGEWLDQPLYAPLRSWMQEGIPDLDVLNAQAHRRGLCSGSGKPLRFDRPGLDGTGYEVRLYRQGVAETRPDCWHDLFGALVWLTFPRAKAALNRRHFDALNHAPLPGAARTRGPVRDALTQFDECGLIVLCADGTDSDSLWQGIRAHRWREVFVERREDVRSKLGFLLFGHGSYDALRAPFHGLCAKAWAFACPPALLAAPLATQIDRADAALADFLTRTADLAPRHWQPLPLLGIPGVTPENEDPAYYDDPRQFRPRRRA